MLVKPSLAVQVLAPQCQLGFALLPLLDGLLPAVPRVARVVGRVDQTLLKIKLRLDHIQPGLADTGPEIDVHQRRTVRRTEDGSQGDSVIGRGGVLERQLGRNTSGAEQTEPRAPAPKVGDAQADDEYANLHPLPLGQLNGLLSRARKIGDNSHVHQVGVVEVEGIFTVQLDRHRTTVLGHEQAALMQDQGELALGDPRVLLHVGQEDAAPGSRRSLLD